MKWANWKYISQVTVDIWKYLFSRLYGFHEIRTIKLVTVSFTMH